MSEDKKESRWKRNMERFREWMDVVKGKIPIKHKLAPLSNPDEIRTSTILTPSQVSFVANAYWLGDTYPSMFGGLKRYALSLMFPAISKRGIGREQQIQFMGAMSEAKAMKKLAVLMSGKGEGKD
jgi:hypothetical protein